MGRNRIKEKNLSYKNKEWLKHKIFIENISFLKISEECKIDLKTLWYWLRKYEIKAPQ